MASILYS